MVLRLGRITTRPSLESRTSASRMGERDKPKRAPRLTSSRGAPGESSMRRISSHTLIGSIIGVGIANALMRGRDGTSGVDWTKATEIGYALLLSPLFGFCMAAVLLLVLKFIVRNPALYAAPEGNKPPPLWIRGILIATCTGVSFAHGSNDGQKGMGLIMLILIGTVPTAYALNRTLPESQVAQFQKTSDAASKA